MHVRHAEGPDASQGHAPDPRTAARGGVGALALLGVASVMLGLWWLWSDYRSPSERCTRTTVVESQLKGSPTQTQGGSTASAPAPEPTAVTTSTTTTCSFANPLMSFPGALMLVGAVLIAPAFIRLMPDGSEMPTPLGQIKAGSGAKAFASAVEDFSRLPLALTNAGGERTSQPASQPLSRHRNDQAPGTSERPDQEDDQDPSQS